MSESWIKIRTDLSDDPNVYIISDGLGLECPTVVGHLVVFWSWMDRHTSDGRGLQLSDSIIDKRVGVQGFSEALRLVGWLEGENGSLQIPKFDRHNGNSAKARSLESEAKRLRRLEKPDKKPAKDKPPSEPTNSASDMCPTNDAPSVGLDEIRGDNKDTTNVVSPSNSSDELESPNTKASKFSFQPEHMTLATSMSEQLLERFPDQQINIDEWADSVRKLEELDGYSFKQIGHIWQWLMAHDDGNFRWGDHVRTPMKLRRADREGLEKFHTKFKRMIMDEHEKKSVSSGSAKSGFVSKHADQAWAEDL